MKCGLSTEKGGRVVKKKLNHLFSRNIVVFFLLVGMIIISCKNAYATSSYPVGQYKVGTDMPVGEYILFASGGKGYFCVSSDSNAKDILFNDNFEYNSIITVRE